MENKINVGDQNTQQVGQNPVKSLQQNFQKPKFNYWIISVIILITTILIISNLSIISNTQKTQKQNKLQTNRKSSPTPTKTQSKIFPIKIYDLQMDNKIVDIKGGPAPCQPNFFDPKVNKYKKVNQEGIPSELYEIEGFQNGIGIMMIDGWYKEGEDKVTLPTPFNVTIYNFGCDSNFSYIIDLNKNGYRQALYTHVLHYSFSKDGKKLFLVNNINNQGNWTLHKRIINIETNKAIEIPNLKCVSELDGFWQDDRLLTYNKNVERSDYQTDICIWDKYAKLISRIGATTAWGSANIDYLAEKIGLLFTNQNIFYTYTSKDENICSLFFTNIFTGATKVIDILDKRNYPTNYYCASPDVEFDFSEFYFNRGLLKYRIEKDKQPSGQVIWNDWQTISITDK